MPPFEVKVRMCNVWRGNIYRSEGDKMGNRVKAVVLERWPLSYFLPFLYFTSLLPVFFSLCLLLYKYNILNSSKSKIFSWK